MSGINGGQGEPVELVDILTGAGANSDSGVNHVDGGDCDNAFPSLHERAITVVPGPCGDGEGGREVHHHGPGDSHHVVPLTIIGRDKDNGRSEEHTSELQSLMRISYAVFCLKKKKQYKHN